MVMAITKHKSQLRMSAGRRNPPLQNGLAERLRETYRNLPHEAICERFVDMLANKRPAVCAPTVSDRTRLVEEWKAALDGMIDGVHALAGDRWHLAQFANELRRHGLSANDRAQMIGTMMAALVCVAGRHWTLETPFEWSMAVTLLFNRAFSEEE